MINRQNWQDVQAFIKYQQEVKQLHQQTSRITWSKLKILLEWAGEKPFNKVTSLKPSFPIYVEGLKTAKGTQFSSLYLSGIFITVQSFFTWIKRENQSRYKAIKPLWIETLRASRARGEQSELHTREIYTVEDILQLMAVPAVTTAQRRTRAGVAFLFLTGMRVGAFMTLPIDCVNLGRKMISQLPERGVKTKNSKAAITFMLNIPELMKVVQEWDAEVRPVLPGRAFWYAHLDPTGNLTVESPKTKNREKAGNSFREALAELCQRAGIPYRSPHKLRHGHAVYSLKRAVNMAQMKAVSQNLMHSNMGITDGIYGKLVNDDVMNIITGL